MKLEATTNNSKDLKCLFGFLKTQLDTIEFECTPKGILMKAVDSCYNVSILSELNAEKFSKFVCDESFEISADLKVLDKVLRNVLKTDVLTIFVEDEKDISEIGIKIVRKGKESTYRISAVDNLSDKFLPSDLTATYPLSIDIQSDEFASGIKDIASIGCSVVQMSYQDGTLAMTGKGSMAKTKVDCKDVTIIKDETNGEIQKVNLNIDKLSEFSKCCSMSKRMIIEMKDGDPLFVKFIVGGLGYVQLCLAPMIAEFD